MRFDNEDDGAAAYAESEGARAQAEAEADNEEAQSQTVSEPRTIPDITMQQIIDAGLNAFGLQLFVESVAGKADAKTFNQFAFRYKGVRVTLEPDGEVDTRHQ